MCSDVSFAFSISLLQRFFDAIDPRLVILLPVCSVGWFLGGALGAVKSMVFQQYEDLCPGFSHSVQWGLNHMLSGLPFGGGGDMALLRCLLSALVLQLQFSFLALLKYRFNLPLILRQWWFADVVTARPSIAALFDGRSHFLQHCHLCPRPSASFLPWPEPGTPPCQSCLIGVFILLMETLVLPLSV